MSLNKLRYRGRRIFMQGSLKSRSVVISGIFLTLSMQRLTCKMAFCQLVTNCQAFCISHGAAWLALSDRLLYKWGSSPGRAVCTPEESCHLFFRPQGRGGVCLPLSRSPSICIWVSTCSPGADLHFSSACYAPLCLAVQDKQAGVRGLKHHASHSCTIYN